jgi:hypothetical protein
MDILEILANSASILSLIISIYALNKVNQIEKKTSVGGNVKFSAKGNQSQQALGDITNTK